MIIRSGSILIRRSYGRVERQKIMMGLHSSVLWVSGNEAFAPKVWLTPTDKDLASQLDLVRTPDGDTDCFDIVAGVLQGDTLALYLFIICLDYVLRTSIDKI